MLKIQTLENIYISSQLALKPDYLIHPTVSGNKFRKLKYNLEKAQSNNYNGILTFGGAFSNHIAATAAAGKELNMPTVGIIRGEELENHVKNNPTLRYAKSCGMHLDFVTRSIYKNKTDPDYLKQLMLTYKNYFVIPEGGTNELAIKGCEEILTEKDQAFDIICCAVGTGGTIAGVINGSLPTQKIIGFPALKGDFLKEDISKFASQTNWKLITDYHFGGYAKINEELVTFINQFKIDNQVSLDPVYTGKMLFGIMDLINKNHFPKGSKILVIHTGGLQGIEGMNAVLRKKNLSIII